MKIKKIKKLQIQKLKTIERAKKKRKLKSSMMPRRYKIRKQFTVCISLGFDTEIFVKSSGFKSSLLNQMLRDIMYQNECYYTFTAYGILDIDGDKKEQILTKGNYDDCVQTIKNYSLRKKFCKFILVCNQNRSYIMYSDKLAVIEKKIIKEEA